MARRWFTSNAYLGATPLGIRSEIGKRAPLHSTSLGKAIAAHLSRGEQGKLLDNYHFYPDNGISRLRNENIFDLELEKVHSLGYAVDEQENEIGGICLGAPIFDHNGAPAAAVSISSPAQRFEARHRSEYSQRLIEVANAISRVLGCTRTENEHKQ
jgi:IclR family transcriptional regulator, KDG regulon repressor